MDPRSPYITSAEDAERFAAARMREMGFADATVTAAGPDGGLDVVARSAVAQVKWMHAKVGRPDLQRLYGARGSNQYKDMPFFAELLSESPYTPQAVAYANEHGIGLFAYTSDRRLFPQNQHANDFAVRVDRVRAARRKKAARMAVVRQGVWSFLLLCSFCGVLITAIDGNPAVGGWLTATILCALGLALAWFYRPGVKQEGRRLGAWPRNKSRKMMSRQSVRELCSERSGTNRAPGTAHIRRPRRGQRVRILHGRLSAESTTA